MARCPPDGYPDHHQLYHRWEYGHGWRGRRAGGRDPAGANGSGMGGAVFNYNGAVTVDDSTISGNTADQGGGIYGVVATGRQTLTINNTILTGSITVARVATTDFVENDLVHYHSSTAASPRSRATST